MSGKSAGFYGIKDIFFEVKAAVPESPGERKILSLLKYGIQGFAPVFRDK